MIDTDLEVYILEAQESNQKRKKESVLAQHKDIIKEMLDKDLTMKQVHNYLINKYEIQSSYYNLTKWIKRHITTNNNSKTIDTTIDKVEIAKERYKSREVIE